MACLLASVDTDLSVRRGLHTQHNKHTLSESNSRIRSEGFSHDERRLYDSEYILLTDENRMRKLSDGYAVF